jgi:hypothetical protein
VPCCCAATSFLPPIAVADSITVNPAVNPRTLNVLSNDIDPCKNQSLGIIVVDSNGNDVATGTLTVTATTNENFGVINVVG